MTDLAERTTAPPSAPSPSVEHPEVTRAWSLRRSLAVLAVVATLTAAVMIAAGAVALSSLTDARGRVIDVIDPAFRDAEQLQVALVDQETGIRGYALAGQEIFLQPWENGLRSERHMTLIQLASGTGGGSESLDSVRERITESLITMVRSSGGDPVRDAQIDPLKRYIAAKLQLPLVTARIGLEYRLNGAH